MIFFQRVKNYFWFLFSVAFLFYFIIYFLFSPSLVSGLVGTFSSKRLTISDSRESESNVTYTFEWSGAGNTLRCIQILFCNEPQWGACNTPTGFDSTGTSSGTWTGLTSANWNLDKTTNGIFQMTNAAGEAPAANVSLEFLGFTNPTNTGSYHARITTYSDVGCTTQVDWGPIPFAILGIGVSITSTVPSPPPPYATVIFQGKTSPIALVTILRNGTATASFSAANSGYFSKTLTGISPGIYTFGIFAEDRTERGTPTISLTLNLASGTTTTVSGIFLPPTIGRSPSTVGGGQLVYLAGEVFPNSQINLFISPGNITKKTTADSQGFWSYKLSTASFAIGQYSIKAKATSPQGEQSQFSKTLYFTVQCNGADLNFDGKVNIFDLSILLYFWGQSNPWNICADINKDKNVNVVDFSIMMYQWTG